MDRPPGNAFPLLVISGRCRLHLIIRIAYGYFDGYLLQLPVQILILCQIQDRITVNVKMHAAQACASRSVNSRSCVVGIPNDSILVCHIRIVARAIFPRHASGGQQRIIPFGPTADIQQIRTLAGCQETHNIGCIHRCAGKGQK
ncbi:hypothetical protein D3C75_746380 [compost metagenome]